VVKGIEPQLFSWQQVAFTTVLPRTRVDSGRQMQTIRGRAQMKVDTNGRQKDGCRLFPKVEVAGRGFLTQSGLSN
jgi:hypothetical protein